MAMDPAAISARPPITMRRVELTAPERPAARAKGTVSPSAIPMTTSRTNSPAVKCFSTCGVVGIFLSDLRMSLQILLSFAHDLAFPAIGELGLGVFQGKPKSTMDFDPHLGPDVVNAAGLVAQQVETNHFEDALSVGPGTNVDVLDVGQFGDQGGDDSGFLAYLADGGFYRVFSLVDQALGQGEDLFAGDRAPGLAGRRFFFFRLNGRDVPPVGHTPEDHAASRKLAYHAHTS